VALRDELQTLRDRRAELEARIEEIGQLTSEPAADAEVEELAELVAEREAIRLLIQSLDRDILDVTAALSAQEREANKGQIRALRDEYAEKVRAVASTTRRLVTQIASAEEARQAVRRAGGSDRELIPRYLGKTASRALFWWKERYVTEAGASPRRRSFQEQSKKDALENAERALSRTMALFRAAKQKQDLVAAEHFQEQVERWQERVRWHGGDPSQIAPSEEVLAPIRPGVVQRVSELPEKISRFGFADWFKRQHSS